MASGRESSRFERVLKHILLALVVLGTMFPVFFLFGLAFSGQQQLNIGLVPIPDNPSVDNFVGFVAGPEVCDAGGPLDTETGLCCPDGSQVRDGTCRTGEPPSMSPVRQRT